MTPVSPEAQRAARARIAASLGVFALVLLLVVVGLVWAAHQNNPADQPPAPAPPPAAAGGPAGAGGWDSAAEAAVAAAPMRGFPESAALPQTVAATALPVIAVPTATRINPAGVGEGFPDTVEGAVGQLAAMETVGLADLNPATFDPAYVSISLPGAPAPQSTPLGSQLAALFDQVGGAGSSGPPVTARWQLAGAQIKGVSNQGRAAVVCVAGELAVAAVNTGQVGTGDCQAMRWTGTDWRIAPVPAAAAAPVTWPGSTDFTVAGYHPTSGGPS